MNKGKTFVFYSCSSSNVMLLKKIKHGIVLFEYQASCFYFQLTPLRRKVTKFQVGKEALGTIKTSSVNWRGGISAYCVPRANDFIIFWFHYVFGNPNEICLKQKCPKLLAYWTIFKHYEKNRVWLLKNWRKNEKQNLNGEFFSKLFWIFG